MNEEAGWRDTILHFFSSCVITNKFSAFLYGDHGLTVMQQYTYVWKCSTGVVASRSCQAENDSNSAVHRLRTNGLVSVPMCEGDMR